MTYDETTLFTKFMQGKGVMNNFEYLYRSHRFDKRELETYLDEVAAEDVILSAFDFTGAGNTIFGFKYWKDIDQKWQAKLTEFRNTGILTADEAEVYCPHCMRVLPRTAFATKSNGVLHKHCRECEGGKWDREKHEREKAAKEAEKHQKALHQLEKEIAEKQAKLERLSAQKPKMEPCGKILENNRDETARQQIADGQANLEKTTKVCSHCGKRKLRTEFYVSDASEDGLQDYCKTCVTELAAAADAADALDRDKHRLEVEIAEQEKKLQDMKRETDEPEIPTAPKLGEHDATMHYKANGKRITLNATLSAAIRYAGLSKCYISTDRQLRQFLVFNNTEGANVTKAGSRRSDLLQVCSSSIVHQIAERFGLSLDETYYLHITKNLSRQTDIINVEVKQVRTREEYASIVANRDNGVNTKNHTETEYGNMPLIDFNEAPNTQAENKSNTEAAQQGIPLANRKPAELLQQLIDRGHLSERDLASFLFQKGWELHEPVIVTRHKKFSI